MSSTEIFTCGILALILLSLLAIDLKNIRKVPMRPSPKLTLLLFLFFACSIAFFAFKKIEVIKTEATIEHVERSDRENTTGIFEASTERKHAGPRRESDPSAISDHKRNVFAAVSEKEMPTTPYQPFKDEKTARADRYSAPTASTIRKILVSVALERSENIREKSSPVSNLYSNQLASFSSHENALEFITENESILGKLFIAVPIDNQNKIYKVLNGEFTDEDAARKYLRTLKGKFPRSFSVDLQKLEIIRSTIP